MTSSHKWYDDVEFSVRDEEAQEASRWATTLGIARSELLREALRRHLVSLAASTEADTNAGVSLDSDDLSIAAIADWGPAEDWSDWSRRYAGW